MTRLTHAQRRPGHQPRRHANGSVIPAVITVPLNEGRGINPGDTLHRAGNLRVGRRPLNEGRGINPGDTPALSRDREAAPALNEGRGINPGDTSMGRK